MFPENPHLTTLFNRLNNDDFCPDISTFTSTSSLPTLDAHPELGFFSAYTPTISPASSSSSLFSFVQAPALIPAPNDLNNNDESGNKPLVASIFPVELESTVPSQVSSIYTSASHGVVEFVPVKSCAHVSYVVGKQGRKIREIRNITKTYIETPVNGDESVFKIRGNPENVLKAKMLIQKSEKEFDDEQFRDALSNSHGENLRFNVYLPSRYIGLVVGRGGFCVKRIMTKCNVQIVSPKINTINSFKITGLQANVLKAIDLMKKQIAEATDSIVQLRTINAREVEMLVFNRVLH